MDELETFFSQLESDLTETVNNEVKEVVEEIVHEQSNAIYNEYEPWGKYPYKRRITKNGYGDRDNVNSIVKGDINKGIEITTTNDTLGNGDDREEYIDEIIENGNGETYKWRHAGGNGLGGHKKPYDYPLPRPVYERSVEMIEDLDVLKNAIDKSMRSKGYTITK